MGKLLVIQNLQSLNHEEILMSEQTNNGYVDGSCNQEPKHAESSGPDGLTNEIQLILKKKIQ